MLQKHFLIVDPHCPISIKNIHIPYYPTTEHVIHVNIPGKSYPVLMLVKYVDHVKNIFTARTFLLAMRYDMQEDLLVASMSLHRGFKLMALLFCVMFLIGSMQVVFM